MQVGEDADQLSVTEAGLLFQGKTLAEALDEARGEFGDGGSMRIPAPKKALGTVAGVLLPCIQNILGIILFLRLPWITAQAGVFLATVIVFLCVFITFSTTLSLSAIVTNGQIKGGGPYYVMSRSLGKVIGAATGLPFYLGTTVASSMYALGAVEAFQTAFGFKDAFTFDTQLEALAVILVLASIVSVGMRYVNMVAGVFLAMMLTSVLAFVVGAVMFAAGVGIESADSLKAADLVTGDNMSPSFTKDEETGLTPSFASLLALFFPSVTGILAGTSRSALLATPSRSIPRGTLLAIALTTALYLGNVWLFGMTVSNATLKRNKMVVSAAAFPHPVVVNIGILTSSIGACLQSLTGAPQLLAAIAKDNVVPALRVFVPRDGKDPVRAVWLTWVIASLPCLAGNLDFVTPAVSMLFLLMYGGINVSCAVLALLKLPGFRPQWRYFHWSTSLLAALGCAAMMLLISWYVALVITVMCAGLYLYASSVQVEHNWGDARQGMRFQLARNALLAMANGPPMHPKNWRPELLVVADVSEEGRMPEAQLPLLDLAAQLKKGRGLTLVAGLVRDAHDPSRLLRAARRLQQLRGSLQTQIMDRSIAGFASVSVEQGWCSGVWSAVQHAGLGPLQPNIVLLPFPESVFRLRDGAPPDEVQVDAVQAGEHVLTMRGVVAAGKSLLLLRLRGSDARLPTAPVTGTLDVWWVVHDGGLLALLSYLLHRHRVWRGTRLRLFSIVPRHEEEAAVLARLRAFLAGVRIRAEVRVIAVDAELVVEWRAAAQRTLEQHTADALHRQLVALGATAPITDVTATVALKGRRDARPAADSIFGGDFFSAPDAQSPDPAAVAPSPPSVPASSPEVAPPNATSSTGASADGGSGGAAAGGEQDEAPLLEGEGVDAGTEAQDDDGDHHHHHDAEETVETDVNVAVRMTTDDELQQSTPVVPLAGGGFTAGARGSAAYRPDASEVAPTAGLSRARAGSTIGRLATALSINALIHQHSANAQLVVTNLPVDRTSPPVQLMQYVHALTHGLERVLLVRGAGHVVVTRYG